LDGIENEGQPTFDKAADMEVHEKEVNVFQVEKPAFAIKQLF
jgi:hypothetical protein